MAKKSRSGKCMKTEQSSARERSRLNNLLEWLQYLVFPLTGGLKSQKTITGVQLLVLGLTVTSSWFASGQLGFLTLLRCFDTVFQRPYRCFSIALKVFFSSSDRYEIFTSNWLWFEICVNVVLSKIDIRYYCDDNKKDQLLKIQHQELKVWCLATS